MADAESPAASSPSNAPVIDHSLLASAAEHRDGNPQMRPKLSSVEDVSAAGGPSNSSKTFNSTAAEAASSL